MKSGANIYFERINPETGYPLPSHSLAASPSTVARRNSEDSKPRLFIQPLREAAVVAVLIVVAAAIVGVVPMAIVLMIFGS